MTGNVTTVNSTAQGWFGLTPDDPGGTPGTSTLNFPRADIRANAVITPIGVDGKLWVTYMSTTGTAKADVVFDVTGYFFILV